MSSGHFSEIANSAAVLHRKLVRNTDCLVLVFRQAAGEPHFPKLCFLRQAIWEFEVVALCYSCSHMVSSILCCGQR